MERSSIDQRIDYRWIDLRTDENQLMFKAQSCFVTVSYTHLDVYKRQMYRMSSSDMDSSRLRVSW